MRRGQHESEHSGNQTMTFYAVDSHPQDSRFRIEGGAAPTLSVKIAKGSADGPLVLIACDTRGHVQSGGV